MGIRVIKTAVAVVTAVYLAILMSLQFPMSAGLLAILGVESTIRKGVVASLERFAASVLGLVLAAVMMKLFGFHYWVIAIYILLIIPVLNRAKLHNGLATCSVTVFHVFSLGYTNMDVVINELLLLVIGLGTATIINAVYMPNAERSLRQKRTATDSLFSIIFSKIAMHLKDHGYIWDGSELLEARAVIDEGVELARRAQENRLLVHEDLYWTAYFHMREQQLDIMEQMLGMVAQVYETLPTGKITAELFEVLSGDVMGESYKGNAEKLLLELELKYKSMPLPVTRSEFEVRSALFQLCQLLHQYLNIAKKEKKHRGFASSL
ncbi:MAG: rane protein [Paenibacillus sp.]|nr:rane protein [Paenibacillus sp.]